MSTVFSVDLVFKSQGGRQIQDLASKLQGVEGNSKKAQSAIDGVGRSATKAGAAATTAGQRMQQAFSKAGQGAQALMGKLRGLQGLLLSAGAGAAIGKTFNDASSLESAQTRIQTLVKNYQQLDGIQQVAAKSAEKFRLSQTESLTALTDLGNRLGAQGASLKDIENIYEGFNTLLANNKVEAAQAASATLQLNQALGSGRLAGEEFNAINEATPQLLDEVARVMGVTRGELKQLASDGEISSQVLIQALTNIREKGAADLEAAFGGAYGATKEFQAAISDFSAAIGTELLPAITPLLRGATELLRLFGQLPQPVKTLTAAVAGLAGAFVLLAPAISAVVTLLGGITVGGLIAAAPWVALAAGIAAVTYQLYQAATAQQQLNDTMAYAPIEEVNQKMIQLQDELAGAEAKLLQVQGEFGALSREAAFAEARVDALRGALEQAQGDYRIRLLYEEVGVTPVSGYYGPGFKDTKPKAQAPPRPTFSGGGGGSKRGGGGKGGVDHAAQEAKQRAERIASLGRELQLEKELTDNREKQLAAELQDNQSLVARLAGQEQLIRLEGERRNAIAEITDAQERQAKLAVINEKAVQSNLNTAFELERIERDRKKALQDALAPVQEDIALLQAKLAGKQKEYELQKQINDLVKQGVTKEQATGLIQQRNELEKQVDAVDKQKKMWTDVYNVISGELQSAIQGLIKGTTDWGDVLSNILNQLGSLFINAAFSGIGAGLKLPGFSGGGYTGDGARVGGLDGEGGFPALLHPGETVVDHRQGDSGIHEAMRRYRAGVGGSGGAGDTAGGQGDGGTTFNWTFQTTSFGGKEFVDREQLEQAMAMTRAQAAKEGASGGYTKTMRTLQNSRSQRAKLGMR